MGRKCRSCKASLPSTESQSTCIACRKDSKDTNGTKSPQTKKSQPIDDRLLDEDDEPTLPKTVSKVAATSDSTQDPVLSMLASVSAELKSLSNRMCIMESGSASERTANPPVSGANAASAASSRPPASASLGAPPLDSDILSDPVEGEERAENIQDREADTLYVEMLQTVKCLLGIQDPEYGDIQPPAAFNKKVSVKSTKKQLSAFPPDEDLSQMWSYRSSKAAGKDAKGNLEHDPLQTGTFLHYQKVNMAHYMTVPQNTPARAQSVPQSFYLLSNKDKNPPFVFTPWKQHVQQERVLRECVQVLERVVHFKRAMAEISGRIARFAQELTDEGKQSESLDHIMSSSSMQNRIIESVEMAMETVLNQVMTLTCNLSLVRRDALLRDCTKLSAEDRMLLRNVSFADSELFPSSIIRDADNNVLKRVHVPSDNSTQSRKRRREHEEDGYSSYSNAPRAFQSSS